MFPEDGDREQIKLLSERLPSLLDAPRCVLKRGKARLSSSRKVECVLLNDAFVILEEKKLLFSKDVCVRLDLRTVPDIRLHLDHVEIGSLKLKFFKEDRDDWIDELCEAICAVRDDGDDYRGLGFSSRHSVLRGTPWRAALDDDDDYPRDCCELDDLDSDGFAPLHLAAFYEHVEALRSLLAAGADPTVRCAPTEAKYENFDDATPLHFAAHNCQTRAVLELLERGALADSVDKSGRSSFYVCASSRACDDEDEDNAFRCLSSLPHPIDLQKNPPLLHVCAYRGYSRTTRLLSRRLGFDVEIVDPCRKSYRPLHVAVETNNVDTARALLAAGAKPNAPIFERDDDSSRNHHPLRPVDLAQSVEMVALLVSHGSRLRRRKPNGSGVSGSPLQSSSRTEVAAASSEWDRASTAPDACFEPVKLTECWMVDTTCCSLCGDPLSVRVRCSSCGDLCCQHCSTKTASLHLDSESHKKVKICDSCFNLFRRQNDAPPSPPPKKTTTIASSEKDVKVELGEQLQLRGEKLEHMAKETEQLQSAAMVYRENARKLRERAERRKSPRFMPLL